MNLEHIEYVIFGFAIGWSFAIVFYGFIYDKLNKEQE